MYEIHGSESWGVGLEGGVCVCSGDGRIGFWP